MALTPINYVIDSADELVEDSTVIETQPEPSKTWRLDLETGRIGSTIDGTEAVRQFIRKAITTSRNRYLIYDDDYGSELKDFIGQTLTDSLADVEIPRLVREAIAYDDRIADVLSADVIRLGDGLHIKVTIELANGDLLTEEVSI